VADKETTPADKKPTSPDTLVEGGKTELTEDELKKVSGGLGGPGGTAQGHEKWIE